MTNLYSIDDTILIKDLSLMKSIANQTALKIVNYLYRNPSYPLEIAENTGIDRQKIYYYIHRLENAGVIRVIDTVRKGGSTAKIYERSANAISYVFGDSGTLCKPMDSEFTTTIPSLYRGFISDGKFNGYICVGSPDPHGEYKASTRDAHMAIMLGLFVGSFSSIPDYYPVALDTDIVSKNLLSNNLIVIGGPVTNIVTKMINRNLPVRFLKEEGWMLHDGSRIHPSDYEGVVQRIRNPFDETKEIIQIGGNKNSGTLAAVLAATKFHQNFISQGRANGHIIVKGYDINGDGTVDSVELVS